ncbi:MAG: hypothetical protein WC117_09920 [Sphaerochaetaceae bacterium]|jgi:predicted nucleic acid-binding protein|nr:hypothetical protein [Sphaerochaetaceae bacterium]
MDDIAICDANILIDFLSASNGKIAISAISSLFSNIYVPDVILAEVSMLSEIEAKELKLKIIETPLNEVSTSEHGRLSQKNTHNQII